MERKTVRENGRQGWTERSSTEAFNRGVAGEKSHAKEAAMERRDAPAPRLSLEPNPFLVDLEEREDRMAEMVGELQSRYEQEIQELDEAEIADGNDVKSRFLDRLLPAHARDRAERYADAREAKIYELGVGLAELDVQEFGPQEPSNDEANYEQERQDCEAEELDFER